MTYRKGCGVSTWGIGVLAVAVLAGCGGSVELSSDGRGGNSNGNSDGKSGGSSGSASIETEHRNIVDHGIVLGTPEPTDGVYAFDADLDGTGSAIYLSSLATPDCARRLTTPAVQAKQPAFSPDGKHLAYAALTFLGRHEIHVLDLESGIVEVVTLSGASAPAYSPNSRHLVYLTGDTDSPVENSHDVLMLNPGELILGQEIQYTILSSYEQACCGSNLRWPAFFSDDELALGTGTELIAINVETLALRKLTPLTGRIPNPQDPSPSPDGERYVYADRCDGVLSLFIGRVDGSSGDSCKDAARIPVDSELVGTDWGPSGFIAASHADRAQGIVLIDDESYEISEPSAAKGGRNPAWAPAGINLAVGCE